MGVSVKVIKSRQSDYSQLSRKFFSLHLNTKVVKVGITVVLGRFSICLEPSSENLCNQLNLIAWEVVRRL